MHSIHKEGKSVVAGRFIRSLKNRIKYLTSTSKNVYIDKLDEIVNKYNTYYSTIKMKPGDVKWSTYIDCSKEINNEDPKLKIGNIVRISKYKSIFAKSYVQNRSEEDSVTTKVKNIAPWTYVISNLKGKEIVGTF